MQIMTALRLIFLHISGGTIQESSDFIRLARNTAPERTIFSNFFHPLCFTHESSTRSQLTQQLSASTGSSLAALFAGYTPATTVVNIANRSPDACEIQVTDIGKFSRFDIRKDIPDPIVIPISQFTAPRSPDSSRNRMGKIQLYRKLRNVDGDILVEVFKLTEIKNLPKLIDGVFIVPNVPYSKVNLVLKSKKIYESSDNRKIMT